MIVQIRKKILEYRPAHFEKKFTQRRIGNKYFLRLALPKNISLTITSKTYISKFYQKTSRPAVQSQYLEYK